MFDLLIKGGRVIDPASDTDGYLDIGVTNGLISAIGPNLEDEFVSGVYDFIVVILSFKYCLFFQLSTLF